MQYPSTIAPNKYIYKARPESPTTCSMHTHDQRLDLST